MRKITDSKLFWLLISLLLSLVIWIYVTSLQSDEYHQVFRNVPDEKFALDLQRRIVLGGLHVNMILSVLMNKVYL